FVGGGEGLPEEGVVPMSAAVVANRRLERLVFDPSDGSEELVERMRREAGLAFERGVEIFDVAGVVFAVVYLHRQGIDVRGERVEGVGEGILCVGGRSLGRTSGQQRGTGGKSSGYSKL